MGRIFLSQGRQIIWKNIMAHPMSYVVTIRGSLSSQNRYNAAFVCLWQNLFCLSNLKFEYRTGRNARMWARVIIWVNICLDNHVPSRSSQFSLKFVFHLWVFGVFTPVARLFCRTFCGFFTVDLAGRKRSLRSH